MQPDTFATRLRALMDAKGIASQADLRRLLSTKTGREVGAQTVSGWFKGRSGCRGADLPALASVLGLRAGSKPALELSHLSSQAARVHRERLAEGESPAA